MLYKPEFINNPTIKTLTFSGQEKKCYIVTIATEEYEACSESSRNRWSSSKRGVYGRGIINTHSDPFKVERIGMLGEAAFAKIFDKSVNVSYIKNGDEQDFVLLGHKVDIKVASGRKEYECGLVYAQGDYGKLIPVDKDLYVFGYLGYDDIVGKIAEVILIGYCTGEYLESLPIVPARYRSSKHKNREVYYKDLQDIVKLREIYFSRAKNRK